jgi:hypothetical protein
MRAYVKKITVCGIETWHATIADTATGAVLYESTHMSERGARTWCLLNWSAMQCR